MGGPLGRSTRFMVQADLSASWYRQILVLHGIGRSTRFMVNLIIQVVGDFFSYFKRHCQQVSTTFPVQQIQLQYKMSWMREAQLKRVTKHLKHVEIIKQESIDCHIIIVMQCLRHIKNRSVRTCHFMIYTHRSPPRPRGFCLFFRLFVWGFWFFYGYFFF